jgi:hypothetical protein
MKSGVVCDFNTSLQPCCVGGAGCTWRADAKHTLLQEEHQFCVISPPSRCGAWGMSKKTGCTCWHPASASMQPDQLQTAAASLYCQTVCQHLSTAGCWGM